MPRSPLRTPVSIGAEWRTRFWTTEPPRYIPHTEWSVRVNVTAVLPLRLAAITSASGVISIEKLHDRGQYFSWAPGLSTQVEPSPADLEDPWRALGVAQPRDAMTWSRLVVRSCNSRIAEIVAFPRQDTESLRNGRWRVRRDLMSYLEPDLSSLAEGAWT